MTAYNPQPAGPYKRPVDTSKSSVSPKIEEIARLPADLENALSGLSAQQLAIKTMPDRWTIAQVVHHIADSHMNAFVRVKFALTEATPTIKPYDESSWADLADANNTNVQTSLGILKNLHSRWTDLFRSLNEQELQRAYFHPEQKREFTVGEVAFLYAWHGQNHLAHIVQTIEMKSIKSG